jgi:hypothetical protein
LKPIGSLSIDDFRNDFEINVIGAVKRFKISTSKKKGTNPSILLFSTVAVKLECRSTLVLLLQKQE